MTKAVKKKNRKLKRQIRKTVGALLMVSAITVAAVPVQDIEAEGLKVEAPDFNDDNRASAKYSVRADLLLDPNGDLTPPTGEGSIYTSYAVRELSDGSFSYNWQFQYYVRDVEGNKRAIISKYNDLYPEREVALGNSANAGYYTVTEDEFNAFYSASGAGYHVYTLTYEKIKAYELGGTDSDVKWFMEHAEENYNRYAAACKAYDDYLDAKAKWDTASANHNSDPTRYPDPGAEPTVVGKPDAITFNPAEDFTNDQKTEYYCGLASELPTSDPAYLPGSGYTLFQVTDNVNPSTDGTAKKIYLARGGTPRIGASNDGNGFLVTSDSTEIIGIAEKAFSGIKNVDTLGLPKEIKYVGDEAFKTSFIKSITFENVANIGNRAFENCSQLTSVTLRGTVKIGVEAFKNSGVEEIELPYSVEEIGDGAFSECHKLRKVDLSNITATCKIDQYAFYNDYAINEVNMEKTGIVAIGEGTFAISNVQTGNWFDAVLPEQITGSGDSLLGDCLFAGRNSLQSVKFPSNYGLNGEVTIPSGMFKNCSGLSYVDFTAAKGSTICGNVGFLDASGNYNNLFVDVLNTDFYVKGPEKNIMGQDAKPRQSTWKSFTRVSNFVPYVYINQNGVECYEVSDGEYLLQANEHKELTSCKPLDQTSQTSIDLIIPNKVGAYEIQTIANGALSDENLRSRIKTITIQDYSLVKLDASVFEGLPNLEEVTVGNSVNSIGDRAFANCRKLEKVTFHKPLIGYEGFTIGTDAFKTESEKLTMYGDIVPGYAPFEFATGKDSGKIDDRGRRICYKSLAPDFLTVMYDAKSDEVVLLDYPKFNELDERNAVHLKEMEKFYYSKYGGIKGTYTEDEDTGNLVYDENGAYDADRKEFTAAWIASGGDESVYDNISYGPWIDSSYLELLKEGYFLKDGESVPSTLPKTYFDKKPYSILENFERGSNARWEYETVTDEELAWINTCLNIIVPAGVTSIDAPAFFDAIENTRNVSGYFRSGDEGYKSYLMCTKSDGDSVPGLFSGYYPDYEEDSEDRERYEEEVRGNDRILSITMYDVKYLPDYAFDSCERLQNISLGNDCQEMGKAPFRGCDSLMNMVGNDYFAAENRIIFTVNEDGSYTIKECLPSRGKAGNSSIITSSTDPKIASVSAIEDGAFEDCDDIVKVFLDDAKNLKIIPKNCFNDCGKLNEVGLPNTVNRIEERAFGGNEGIEVTIPGKEVHIVKDAFEHVTTNTINTYKGTSADDYGQYYNLNVEYLSDLFTVRFYDDDGTLLKEQKDIVAHQNATPPDAPDKEGYTFKGWQPDYHDITENRVVIAQYSDNSGSANRHTVTFYADDGKTVVSKQEVDHNSSAVAPMPPSKTGYTFVAWAGNYTNVVKDETVVATYTPNTSTSPRPGSSGNPGTSASPTATPTNGENEVKKYRVTVSGGSGTGDYPAGAVVAINAYDMGVGQNFDKWTSSTAGVGFADATARSTTFTMPASNVSITATYKIGGGSAGGSSGGSSSAGGGTGGSNGGSVSNNGTVVEVTKPGISNTNLAGATVSGATDNFVIKVTEDPTATSAVIAALQERYGDISRIQYLPMDISLYDSTGRIKIADTTGISVNLTLPLPDELIQYAGNNRVAAVSNGVLEDLDIRFTTVGGVPCVNFTASHFSPYVIYVDTANLTEATIDSTPKTGDPIHPKWFLALGLACTSLILFFKRDKVVLNTKNA